MNTQQAVADRIRQLCREKGFTPNGISIFSAVPQATVKSILNGESQNPGIVTLKNSVTVSVSPSANSSPRRNLMPWSRRSNNRK